MSWHERPYAGGGGGWRFADNPLMWAPSIGTVFGIRIRVHMLFILYIAFELLGAGGNFLYSAHFLFILFGSVFLHELGHCYAARKVGGSADEVLMWPLGGLATVDGPRTPWPQFAIAIGGPCVTLLLLVISRTIMWLAMGANRHVPMSPFWWPNFSNPWVSPWAWLDLTFRTNLGLFLFNLWPMYPMDGGRMLQCGLWWKMGLRRSMFVTTAVGMVAAVIMGFVAILPSMWGDHDGGGLRSSVSSINFTLLAIAVMGYMTCWQQRQMAAAGVGYDDDFSGMGYTAERSEQREGWMSRWRRKRAEAQRRRQAAEIEAEQVEVDRILAKVHDHGIGSLTRGEKRTLETATQRERQRQQPMSGRR